MTPADHHGEVLTGTCGVAFKEWAAICQALAGGHQIVILRKGGIHEGREGFRIAHRGFWLYPTRFHESADQLTAEASPFVEQARAAAPPPGQIRLGPLAIVTDVREIAEEAHLSRLAGSHLWAPATLSARFHYRQPGLFLLLARIYRRPEPWELAETQAMAGCRSWVELDSSLPTTELTPVLSPEEYTSRRAELLDRLSSDPR